ncbi:14153_t:CDS:2, partial [Cetraspora pellucida]
MESHLALHCKGEVSDNIKHYYLIEVAKQNDKINNNDSDNETLLKAFVCAGITFSVIDNLFVYDLFSILEPGYTPPGRVTLAERAIYNIEARTATLADCFISLVKIAVAINRIPLNNVFCESAIVIFNKRYAKYDIEPYLLTYFLHPEYRESMAKIHSFYISNLKNKLKYYDKELSESELYDSALALTTYTAVENNNITLKQHKNTLESIQLRNEKLQISFIVDLSHSDFGEQSNFEEISHTMYTTQRSGNMDFDPIEIVEKTFKANKKRQEIQKKITNTYHLLTFANMTTDMTILLVFFSPNIRAQPQQRPKTRGFWIDIFPNLADNEVFSCEAPNSIPVWKQIAIVLWWFANRTGIQVLEQTLGISQGSVCHFTDRFLKALLDIEQEKIIWPQESKLATITQEFEHKISGLENNLLNVIGAMNGSHIPIHPPSKNGFRFVNHKNFYFINLLGVVDYLGCFTYVHIGEADNEVEEDNEDNTDEYTDENEKDNIA